MSEELTPLESLNDLKNSGLVKDNAVCFTKKAFEKRLDIIETALKRLEEHDKIFKKYDINDIWLEPALYVIKNYFPMDTETQLNELKVLEIIKSADFLLEFDESQNEWFLYISDEEQCVLVTKGTGVETYNLLKEELL